MSAYVYQMGVSLVEARQWPAAGLSLLAVAIVLTAAMLSGH